jgi:hypothetical protein
VISEQPDAMHYEETLLASMLRPPAKMPEVVKSLEQTQRDFDPDAR